MNDTSPSEISVPPAPRDLQVLREQAWIGDSVLELFARRHILSAGKGVDAERCRGLTANDFLTCFGNPTEVEAGIGRIFEAHGIQAAFQYIEKALLPIFTAREKRQVRPGAAKNRA